MIRIKRQSRPRLKDLLDYILLHSPAQERRPVASSPLLPISGSLVIFEMWEDGGDSTSAVLSSPTRAAPRGRADLTLSLVRSSSSRTCTHILSHIFYIFSTLSGHSINRLLDSVRSDHNSA